MISRATLLAIHIQHRVRRIAYQFQFSEQRGELDAQSLLVPFLFLHRSGRVAGLNLEIDHHPVVRVTWADAARYCNWLNQKESLPPAYESRGGKLVAVVPPTVGYRLPTEAEWVRVARYPAGEAGRKYPWGDSLPVAANSGNYADASARGLVPATLPHYDDSYPATAPAEGFAPNPLGFFNLGGNVAEWMHDYYTIYPSEAGIERDPLGPRQGDEA